MEQIDERLAEIEARLNQLWGLQRAKISQALGPEEQARPGHDDYLKTLELVYRSSYWHAIADVAMGLVKVIAPVIVPLEFLKQ
jgi:hypothetical protein